MSKISMPMNFDNVLVEKDGAIAVVTMNRPQALNALSYALVKDLSLALQELDQDNEVRVIVVTGGEKVFAAGADIKEMAERGPFDELIQERLAYRDRINRIGKPEVNLGIIPGSGGTQRLTHLLGKHRAMELVLTGEAINATEAERLGLVNRVLPVELFLEEAKNIARKIAAKPVLAIKAAKEAVLKAANTPLDEGLDYERKSFYLLFASEDRREGMQAFLEKRKPEFKGK
jgi:enoyl-CoA hydratase